MTNTLNRLLLGALLVTPILAAGTPVLAGPNPVTANPSATMRLLQGLPTLSFSDKLATAGDRLTTQRDPALKLAGLGTGGGLRGSGGTNGPALDGLKHRPAVLESITLPSGERITLRR